MKISFTFDDDDDKTLDAAQAFLKTSRIGVLRHCIESLAKANETNLNMVKCKSQLRHPMISISANTKEMETTVRRLQKRYGCNTSELARSAFAWWTKTNKASINKARRGIAAARASYFDSTN